MIYRLRVLYSARFTVIGFGVILYRSSDFVHFNIVLRVESIDLRSTQLHRHITVAKR
jgi:hypothetical protein